MKAFKFNEFNPTATPDWKAMFTRWAIILGILVAPSLVAVGYMVMKGLPPVAVLVCTALVCYLPLAFYRKAPVAVLDSKFEVTYIAPARPNSKLIMQGLGKIALFLFFSFFAWLFTRGVL